jgi:hypothetical protein
MNVFLEIAASAFARARSHQIAVLLGSGTSGCQTATDSSPQAVAGKEIGQFRLANFAMTVTQGAHKDGFFIGHV